MAHCVHCCDKEVALLRETEAGVVHCPSSNFMLKSGVCDVRRLLLKGVKVTLLCTCSRFFLLLSTLYFVVKRKL